MGLGSRSSVERDILRGANIGKWVFELIEKIFPFLKPIEADKQFREPHEIPWIEILKFSFKAAFVVGFGVLFYTEVLSLPLFILNGKISQIPKWLPYSLIPAAGVSIFVFVLLIIGGIIIKIKHKLGNKNAN